MFPGATSTSMHSSMVKMRVLQLLLAASLSIFSVAAKKSPSAFDIYQKKQFPITLNEQQYDELTSVPRDYYSAVVLTALDAKYACGICREFQPEWDVIGKSWQKGDKKGQSRVLFATLDFDQGRNVFMKHQLQTAPVLFLFPPTTGANASPDGQPTRLDFLGPQTAEGIHGWIQRQLPAGDYPQLVRPFNWSKLITTVTIVIGIFTFGTVAYPYILPVIQNRNLWALLSLIMVLMFTSGHMYNHIRKVPYVTGNGKGGITYFAGGFSNQFGIETQIIAAVYAVLSFATISLGLKVPRMKDARTQQIAAIIWASVAFGMYSFLMSLFRIKNGGYPFWLPPF
ncbi:oligosaccharyl transferase subunit ost3/OST6 [Lithohypha guttulata]|uniref:oligosaccharyl transferase subunit ost3/OST6 n=1 Tax=Lithohypha guttulata TaxID=1690604 RepID=UPI00315CB3C6